MHSRSSLLADLGALKLAAQRTVPRPDPDAASPITWMHKRLGEHLWSRQRKIAASVRDHRYTAVPACHGPGKSFLAARLTCWWLMAHSPGTAFVVTTAPSGPQVKGILWREIARAHRRAGLPGRVTLDARWYWPFGSNEELVAFGRKPRVEKAGDQDLASAFQGIHAEFVLVVIDEAAGVPRAIFDAADTLATTAGSRVLAIGNPDDPMCAFADACAPGSGWNTIPISAFDTPNFTGEPVPAALGQMLVGPDWVEERRKRWGEGSPMWTSKVLGQFPQAREDAVFTPTMIRAAQDTDRPEQPGVTGVLACDIARLGGDEAVVFRVQAGRCRRVLTMREVDTMTLANRIGATSDRLSRAVPMVVDITGVGGGVYDRLLEMGHPALPFEGGGRAHQPKRFMNRRAECYWKLRNDMEQGLVDIDATDDILAAQLGGVRFFIDPRGRIGIESKDELKRRGMPSPDRADALAMGWAYQDSDPVGFRALRRNSSLTSDLLTRPM